MSKKMILVIAVILILIAVVIAVFMMQRPAAESNNATIKNIESGVYRIACEDAKWLLDKNFEMIAEKMAQLDEFENGDMTAEEYLKMQNVMYNEPSPAQKAMNDWHNEVILGIAALHRADVQKQEVIQNAIGKGYLEIYQVAMATKLELMNEADMRAALEENFCANERKREFARNFTSSRHKSDTFAE